MRKLLEKEKSKTKEEMVYKTPIELVRLMWIKIGKEGQCLANSASRKREDVSGYQLSMSINSSNSHSTAAQGNRKKARELSLIHELNCETNIFKEKIK